MSAREGLASAVDTSLLARRVIQTLEEIALERGYPERIVCDNGPEFRSRVQNPFVDSFNGKMRDECLNVHWFANVEEARLLIEGWRRNYTQVKAAQLSGKSDAERVRRGVQHSDRAAGIGHLELAAKGSRSMRTGFS
jgi:putative transposase